MIKHLLVFGFLFVIFSCGKEAAITEQTQTVGTLEEVTPAALNNGNAQDYLLNLIGVPKDKEAAMDDNNGRRIFVRLNGGETVTNPGGKWKEGKGFDDLDKINKILLQEGDFQVLDANATDDDGALFQLPDPVADDGTAPTYHIKARALGKPGGYATLTTCAEESFDGNTDIWCGSNGVTIEGHGKGGNGNKGGGKPVVVDVTENLLKMTLTIDPDLDPELAACLGFEDTDADDPEVETDVWLFDSCFENYFWNYDNHGLKLLQLRFYYVD
ncbi:MAG: hypothetical protein OEQ53_19140 [Saprospiraceae bacterium]|nr:hypothetical protein [Saprospiraceae bacterium]